MKYRAEIDGLRALAVVPVVLFHAGISVFSGGFLGVDIFFVISGYLIATIIINEMDAGTFSLVNFYERRARRILPALFLVVFACIVMAWFWLLPSDMKDFSQSLIAVSSFLSNMLFWWESGYFDSVAILKPLLHTWSLAVEEQYYIIFPIFLMLFWRFGRRVVLYLLVAIFVASLGLAHWSAYNDPSAAFFFLTTRGWELLVGVFCALYLQKNEISNTRFSQIASAAGAVLILISIFVFDEHTPNPSLYTLAPTVGTALLILFAVKGTLTNQILSRKTFVAVGLISYSTYLWHQPIFAFCRRLYFEEPPIAVMIVLMFVSLALAYVSWKYVEAPFRNKKKIGRAKVFAFSIVCMALVGGIGAVGYLSDGFNNRSQFVEIDRQINDMPVLDYVACDPEAMGIAQFGYCYRARGGPPNAAILGDSHADDKFYGIEKNVTDRNWVLLGQPSCPPTLGISISADTGECTQKITSIYDYVTKNNDIDLVVLSFAHSYPLSTNFVADDVAVKMDRSRFLIERLNGEPGGKIEIFSEGLANSIEALVAANKKVVVVYDTPPLPYFPSKCLRFNRACDTSVDVVDARQKTHRTEIAKIVNDYPQVKIFDPKDIFCDDARCKIFADNTLMYRDSHHLTYAGSDTYGQAFNTWLKSNLP